MLHVDARRIEEPADAVGSAVRIHSDRSDIDCVPKLVAS